MNNSLPSSVTPSVTVREGTLAEAWAIYQQMPEFVGGLLDQSQFEHRLAQGSAIILIACQDDEALGFKVGFDRYADGSFYSWLGGVVKPARRQGVARALLLEQEKKVIAAGFDRVYVKTLNRYTGMLTLLLTNGYGVVGVKLPDDLPVADGRLTLVKILRG